MDAKRKLDEEVYTVTFGDAGESHVRTQICGKRAEHGMSVAHLERVESELLEMDPTMRTKLYNLGACAGLSTKNSPYAAVLVVKDGINLFTDDNKERVTAELAGKETDKQAKMYGVVRHKTAGHNFMFAGFAQKPDYPNGKGTIYAFEDNPAVDQLRKTLSIWAGIEDPANMLAVGEVNHYYAVNKTYIGYHGDAERAYVVGCRVGEPVFPLRFHCHADGRPIGNTVEIPLEDGDVYFMSDLAVGNKWKTKGTHWRHSAGLKSVAPDAYMEYKRKMDAKERKHRKLA